MNKINNKKFIFSSLPRYMAPTISVKMRTVFFLTILLILADYSRPSHATMTDSYGGNSNKDLIITSDSTNYCSSLNQHLTEKLAKSPSLSTPVTQDITHLQNNGVALCHAHHIRAGIERLRRALYLLRYSTTLPKPNPPPKEGVSLK